MAKTSKTKPKPRRRRSRRASLDPLAPNFQPSNKGKRYPVEVLTEDEVPRLIRACSNRAPTGVRNKALIVLLWRGQLRVSEALALQPKDLDRSSGTARVLRGKGSKARTVGLDEGAFAIVERWLDVRADRGIKGRNKPLFCTLDGTALDASYVRRMLKRMAIRAGIEKRVHPHGLRHTGASELLSEGVDVGVISKQLGHKSIATTARYLDHISPQRVIDTMRQRSWEL